MMINRDARKSSAEVVIVGGGIMGCALAYDLASRGVDVLLLERRELAREASWASAGIISPPSPRYGTKAELALRSFRRYRSLVDEVEEISGIATGWVNRGIVNVATDENAAALHETLHWQQQHRLDAEWLDLDALRRREPALRSDDQASSGAITGGLLNTQASSLLLGEFARALARAACARGATVREHTLVLDIPKSGSRATGVRTIDETIDAGAVVIAAGAWSRQFSHAVGLSIPTRPVRGQMVAIADAPIPLAGVIQGMGGYLVPRADGTVAVGATEEHEAGFAAQVTPAGIDWLVALIDRLTPSLKDGRLVSLWAGLRPASDDDELIVGRVPNLDNVWVCTGHFRSGALLAPGTAELLAESIVSGSVAPQLAAFDPGRFA
ncbi:MAG TPA: glycine oxidase ThiO [Nitrolancea sp.]|nr:glycine oxidase ThiO [Nitrolancea sp.]